MSDIATFRLGPKIEIRPGFPFRSQHFTEGSGTPLIRIRDLLRHKTETNYSGPYVDGYLIRAGDVLVGMDGAFNVVRWKGEPGLLNQRVCRLRSTSNSLDESYLYHWLGTKLQEIHSRTAETTVRHLSVFDIDAIELPDLPEPEQVFVGRVLDAIDCAIDEIDAIIAKLQRIKAGLLHDLLTRGIDENGELRDPVAHPEQFNLSSVGVLHANWDVAPLDAFASSNPNSFVNGPFGSDLLTRELKSEGVPVIYVRDIKEGAYLRVSTVHVTEEKASQLRFCDVQFGDVLVAKVGDPPCDAAPYLSPEKAIITQDVIRIRPARNTDSRFLSYVINSSFGRLGVRGIVIEATRARVSLRDFKRVRVPKPPFAEQTEISRRLAEQEQRIADEAAQLTKFRLIKVGLMNDLLTGKVRVPWREAAS